MPGPNSAPNGDARLVVGVSQDYMCERHADKELDECLDRHPSLVVPLRYYLAKRNRLRTGKTK